MCYHVSTPSISKILEQLPQYDIEGELDPKFHISGFARPYLYTTLNEAPAVIKPARWKLLPFWVKTEQDAAKYANTLNADSDTIFETKSYSPFILKYRGVLWVDGFYEPHQVEGVKETENYYIYQEEKKIFPIGIVYAPWTNKETGELINTFSVVTVPANPQLAEIHNEKKRMPLVLTPEKIAGWFKATSKEEVKSFFQPFEMELKAHRVFRVTAPPRGMDTNISEIQNPI